MDDRPVQAVATLRTLSRSPQSAPCLLLRWNHNLIMLDCSLSTSSLLSFLPCSYLDSSTYSFDRLKIWSGGRTKQLKETEEGVFIDARLEFQPPNLNWVPVSELDAVLISNSWSMMGLPYLTSHPEFRATVYATDPTLQFGQVLIEEMLAFSERLLEKPEFESELRRGEVWLEFPNQPNDPVSPHHWRSFYTREQYNNAITFCETIAFKEKIELFDQLKISCYNSGIAIGSCNWIIETENQRLAYLAASSSLTTHTRLIDTSPFRDLSGLVVGGLSGPSASNPEMIVNQFCTTTVRILKSGGNVLVPCNPVGIIYDLIECLVNRIEAEGLDRDIPVFFLSPVAHAALAYANIYPEWLAADKQAKVFLPEPKQPFPSASTSTSKGRLRCHKGIEDFSKDLHSPCVVFCGHPSLRLGDAVHILSVWKSDPANALLYIEAETPLKDALAPFQPVKIQTFWFPIDPRLSPTQANKLLKDSWPKNVYAPKALLKSVTIDGGNSIVWEPQTAYDTPMPVFIPLTESVASLGKEEKSEKNKLSTWRKGDATFDNKTAKIL